MTSRRLFQSTLPTRGATAEIAHLRAKGSFNPRSPRGERLGVGLGDGFAYLVSIHAPHAGSDSPCSRNACWMRFQSTLPTRGATRHPSPRRTHRRRFNPRSPGGERPSYWSWRGTYRSFNPRSPRGERHRPRGSSPVSLPFQSTLPTRGATAIYAVTSDFPQFQSTLPTRGATIVGDRT